ncbi:MAG: hypothetical protein HY579_02355 [Nitrospinae bacterium]|nr:hypothetical protein [Nitrospinota bacterium]
MQISFKPLSILAAFFIVALTASESAADGDLTLIARSGEGRQKIRLAEEGGILKGDIKEGLAFVAPLRASYQKDVFIIGVGNKNYAIDRLDLGEFISYGGLIFDDRGFSAQAEKKGDSWIVSGTIEDEMRHLVNFDAVADDKKGLLKLSWGDNFVNLRKTPDKGKGTCLGNMIKESSEKMVFFWCASSGSLMDAFFNNPDQIIAWLILLFIR